MGNICHRCCVIGMLLLFFVLVFTGLAAADSMAEEKPAPQEAELTVAVTPWPGSAAVYIAREKGFFKEEGLEVSFLSYSSGHLGLEAVLAGKADISTTGETPLARAALNGHSFAIIATIAKTNRAIRIIARKERGITGPKDLGGKTVGVVRGTTGEFFLHLLLTTSYIDPKQVTIVNAFPGNLTESLLNGTVDAVSIWEPYATVLEEKLGDNAVILHDPGLYTMTWNLVSRWETAINGPEQVTKFLRAIIRANRFIADQPVRSRNMISGYLEETRCDREEKWEHFTFTTELDQSLILNLEDQARWMNGKAEGRKGMPNYLDMIFSGALKSVKPEAVTIPGK